MTDIEHLERLRALGWNALQASFFNELPHTLRPARVLAVHRGAFVVDDGEQELRASVSGRLRHAFSAPAEYPTVGDWVAITGLHNEGRIESVAPRASVLLRRAAGKATQAQALAANVDLVLLAAALPNDVNLHRLERGISLVWESGALPIVLLTKADLSEDVEGALVVARNRLTGVDVIALSTVTGDGVEEFRRLLSPASTAVLLGASGAGKSTLVNTLLGSAQLRTLPVRADGKGRHTTTARQLLRLANGAMLIDTPGLRELQLWGDDASVNATFDDVSALAQTCRFADCRHESEPGCAVLAAFARGELDADRLAHWRKLRAELEFLASRDDPRAQSEIKRRGAIGAKAARAHIRSKYK